MEPQKLKKLADMFGSDLSGWQIAQCHFLELDHGLWGTFPAIDENKEIVATLDKQALENVWKRLERRPAKITSIMVVAHPASGVAFKLDNYFKGDAKPFHILSAEAINILCQKENSVRWAPGMLQLSEQPVRDPVFT